MTKHTPNAADVMLGGFLPRATVVRPREGFSQMLGALKHVAEMHVGEPISAETIRIVTYAIAKAEGR